MNAQDRFEWQEDDLEDDAAPDPTPPEFEAEPASP